MAADAHASGTFVIGGDMEVRRMGFGAMRITGPGIFGEPADVDEARRVLRRLPELGINFVDTADSYGPEVSERLIGEELRADGDVVVATKGGLVRPEPYVWNRDCRPERLKQCCDESLSRLGVERIDLYQLHAVDPEVPYAESVGALAELKAEGKIRHVGVSNVGTAELEEARAIVDVVSVQNRYSIVDRDSEAVLEVCERDGLAFIPWWPLKAGDLAEDQRSALDDVASAHDATIFQVALAWLLRRSPVMLPIPGTSKVDHLEENTAAAGIELTDEQYEKLGALARV